MNTSDHVSVSFISESRTEFSGFNFSGTGIIDLIEDRRVYGHLYSGQPFMCDPTDVSVNVDIHNLDKYYQLLLELKLASHAEIELIKSKSSEDPQLLNMAEFGLYIFAHFQSLINGMAQQIAASEFQRIQDEFTNGRVFLVDA